MRLTAPRSTTFLLSLVAAGLGVLLHEGILSSGVLDRYTFWLVAGGYALLMAGVLTRRL